MLDTDSLHNIIKEVFNLDDSYIIPITSNWFIPDSEFLDKESLYIGYRIIANRKASSNNPHNESKKSYIKTSFRLSFIGANAEKYASQINFWEDMKDIQKIFAKYKVQINYEDLTSFTYPVRNPNFNMAWVFDMSVKSDYQDDLKLVKAERKLITDKKKRLLLFKKN